MIKQTIRPQPILHVGNGLVALLFISLGSVDLMNGEWIDASIWLSLGAALVVLGEESRPWASIPTWRRVLGGALTLGGVLMLSTRLWLDFNQ